MTKLSSDSKLTFHVPLWASFFAPGEYADFIQLVTSDLRRRGLTAHLRDGSALLERPGSDLRSISLLNLSQMCKHADRAGWQTLISGFFDSMLRAESDAPTLVERMRSLDGVRNTIKIRLHPESAEGARASSASSLVLRRVAPGISALLVCDFGFANLSVPAAFLESWGVSPDEVFELGLRNVRAEERLHVSRSPVTMGSPGVGGSSMDILSGPGHYTASHVLFLDDYALSEGDRAPYGAIVAVPTRDVILRHIIRDSSVIEALRFMHTAARDLHGRGPAPISAELYWWRRGELRLFPTRLNRGALELRPTEEFQENVLRAMIKSN